MKLKKVHCLEIFFFFISNDEISPTTCRVNKQTKTPRRIAPRCAASSSSSSGEVFAVCGVDDAVRRAPEETVRAEEDEGKRPFRTHKLAGSHSVGAVLHSPLTPEGMSCTSGIQSPFHRTPQRPHGGIHLRSRRACTLQSEESVAAGSGFGGQRSRPSQQTERKKKK